MSAEITTPSGAMKTIHGKEILARSLIAMATNKEYPNNIRFNAIDKIMERIDGKANQTMEIVADVQEKKGLGVDISKLSAEEKLAFEKMLEKMNGDE